MIYAHCPACGASAPLEAYLSDAEARQAMSALCLRLADWPDVVRRVPAYLSLHAPVGRKTQWRKVSRLIGELADLLAAPTVSRDGQPRPCTPAHWAEAMDQAQDARTAGRLDLPLEGHGWLTQVAWTIAGRARRQADAQRAARDRGETPVGYSAAHIAPGQAIPDAAAERREEIADLMAERARHRRLADLGLPEESPGALADCEARLAALGVDPAARPSRPAARRGTPIPIAALLRRPTTPEA